MSSDFQWPGYVPWREPKPSGNYTERFPTHFSFAPGVERVARDVVERFDVSANTYHFHPPGAPAYERVSLDVWGRKGRGDPLNPAVGQKVFEYLFNLPGDPEISWAIYRGSMWQRGIGWGPSPSGPGDSDPRHDHHIHVSYALKHDIPKDDSPMTEPLWGVDVSNHQQAVNWRQVKREGFSFGICKASEGTYYSDPYCKPNLAGMKEAGIIPGAYHFLTNEPTKAQLNLFLRQLGDPKGKLVAVDVEETNWGGDPTATDLWNFVHALRDRIGDHPILVYSGYWYWGDRLGNPDIGSLIKDYGVSLWVSRYVSGRGYASSLYESVPAGWWRGEDRGGFGNYPPTILQFTDSALVAGKYIDANAFAGTQADLLALTKPGKPIKPPDSPPGPKKGYQVIIGSREKPLKKKQAENIVRARRKYGQDARVKELGVWESAAKRDEGEYMQEPQNQRRKTDSPGPSNRASQDEETALRPGRKVSAATAAMFLTTIIAYVLNQFYGIELPPEVSAAVTGLLGILVAYWVPEGS